MQVRTILAYSPLGLEEQIKKYKEQGFVPTLGIAFTSITLNFDEVRKVFDKQEIDVFGCSTAGEILNDEVFDGAITGLLFDLDSSSYGIHLDSYEAGPFEAGKSAGIFATELFKNPAIMVASGGVIIDAEQIVFGLRAGAGEQPAVFGGVAADDLGFQKTFAFTRKEITDNGLISLVFDADKVEVKGMATSGWEAVGMENTITKANGNIVHTINNEPALDVFIKYFGYFDNSQVKGKSISTISAQYPLQIVKKDGTTVLRSPLVGNESDGTLVLAGGVREGDKFRFSIIPGFEVIEQTIEDFGHLRHENEHADALVLFSCKGRHAALGPLIEDEIKGIYDYWQRPMAGFFTYGEIGATREGVCEFHNETCSLVLFKEKATI